MIRKHIFAAVLTSLILGPLAGQDKSGQGSLNREITLFNPYKPSLNTAKKRSFLPDMKDTSVLRPSFRYDVTSVPFLPDYTISPIKAASIMPDPLPRLYKSYINLGLGNYLTPLAEISITNERSKKGALGFYGRHFSQNSSIALANSKKVHAGTMDNEASLFGKKFFRKSILEGSADFQQIVRHAYGYNPAIMTYDPVKKDIRMPYSNLGAKAVFRSTDVDSISTEFNFGLHYNYFYHIANQAQHNYGLDGFLAKPFKGFYVGSAVNVDLYKSSDSISTKTDALVSLSPFISKTTRQWNFRLGLQALVDRESKFHMYPDVTFGFAVVPSYVSFYASMAGRLERNDPLKIAIENPYLANSQYPSFMPAATLFRLPDTDHELVISAGLKGNTGLEGRYLVSASYSMINNMLFYSGLLNSEPVNPALGNYFSVVTDDVELLNIHAEMNGRFSDKLTFALNADYNDYNTSIAAPWYKPSWNGEFGLKYDLRSKIIAGLSLTGQGKRKGVLNADKASALLGYATTEYDLPVYFNMNLSAEYRYSKILSLWMRLDNIALKGYEEWIFYPTRRFQFMLGFTYSL